MKKTFAWVGLAALFIGLVGCSTGPTMFGMPEKQFKRLPVNQQEQVIASYNRQKEIKAKNQPIDNAINTLGFLGESNSKH